MLCSDLWAEQPRRDADGRVICAHTLDDILREVRLQARGEEPESCRTPLYLGQQGHSSSIKGGCSESHQHGEDDALLP